jgi:glucose/arabinose dehydrogenase
MDSRDARTRWPYVLAAAALPLAVGMAYVVFPEAAGRLLVVLLSPKYSPAGRGVTRPGAPVYEGKDLSREKIEVRLEKVADGFKQPTDVQFFPDAPERAVVLEKGGVARWVSVADGSTGVLFEQKVATVSEQGLLGLAFHPGFATNRQFFINYVGATPDGDFTFVERWQLDTAPDAEHPAAAHRVQEILRELQPYQNHNGGQLVFGPDGYLYIGLGDGGLRDDPHGNGQNPAALLGKMLRIDVDRQGPGLGYAIPADNPFVGKPEFRPEVWAYGLRNPWRYSFDPSGRLIVADVGQNRFEEISIVPRGGNMGWALREGFACFPPERKCGADQSLVDPIVVYGRDEGLSITGGFVYTGKDVPALRGRYLFGDFVTGRIWAVTLPATEGAPTVPPVVTALGQWPVLPSSFGRDAQGEVYVVDYSKGGLYRLAAGSAQGGHGEVAPGAPAAPASPPAPAAPATKP